MAKPDPLDVRAYQVALKRHRDVAVREASDLERLAHNLLTELRRNGSATVGEGRRALSAAVDLLERLVALQTLQQDAKHFTVET